MNLKTKRTICLVVGVASILAIVGTISYAYFTATGETRPVQTTINTATVSVRFADNDTGITGSLSFGESLTKKFTITNTGTVDTDVKMYWVNMVNTYTEGSLTYTLSYAENESGPYTEVINKTNVPLSKTPSKKLLTRSLTIPVGKTYYYNLVITYNYLEDVNQNSDADATFYSYFNIVDVNVPNITKIIATSSKGEKTSFAEPATTDEGIFEMEDDYGTSYYYRGAVENNYVQFAGFYWRIIRINGDGSMRIIYDGTTTHANGESSGDRFTHLNQPYNALYNDNKYVGWMYGPANTTEGSTTPSSTKAEAQSNVADSDIKRVVDTWYKENIVDKGYASAVSDTLFCNDRVAPGASVTGNSYDTGRPYGSNYTIYAGYARFWNGGGANYTSPKPTLKCEQKNDRFTVSDEEKGNGSLTYPVGLITSDEIVIAGSGKLGTANNSYYLFKSNDYSMWTMTPDGFSEDNEYSVEGVLTSGALSVIIGNKHSSIAPVINLSAEYTRMMIGDGTIGNEYRAE